MENIATTTEDTNNTQNTIVAYALVGFAAYGVFTAVTKVNKIVKHRVENRAVRKFQKQLAQDTKVG